MIEINSNPIPSKHIKRRSALMWAVKLRGRNPSIVRYRVTPYGDAFDHHNKSKRIVTIDLEKGTAECVDRFTGELCQANADFVPGQPDVPKQPKLCSHVYAVLRRIEINSRKERRGLAA